MPLLTTDKVRNLLEKRKHLRDSDSRLIATIWLSEAKNMGHLAEEAKRAIANFLSAYVEGRLTPAESIRRTRQKIQEHEPHLRGEKWDERHAQAEDVKQEIRDHSASVVQP